MSDRKKVLSVFPAAFCAALLIAAGCAGPGAEMKAEGPALEMAVPSEGLVIHEITAEEREGGMVVTVVGSQPLSYSIFKLDDPLRLAVDLPGTSLGEFQRNIPVNKGAVSFIKPVPGAIASERGPGVARLEIFLSGPAGYEVDSVENALNIVVAGAATQPAAEAEAAAVEEAAVEEAAVEEAAAEEPEIVAESLPELSEPAATETGGQEGTEAAGRATRLSMLDVVSSAQGTQIIIEGDGAMEYEFFLVESKSLVVDIYGVTNGIFPLSRSLDDEFVKQVRVGEHFAPRQKVRVVMDLAKQTDYKLVVADNKLLVNFGALSRESDEQLVASLSNVVTDVYFRPMEDRSLLEIVAAQQPTYQVVDSEDPNRLILEIDNSRVAPEAQKTLDLVTLNREVSKVVSFQYRRDGTPVVRVVTQFKERVPYRIEAVDNKVLVEIPRVRKAVVAAVAAPAPEAAPAAQPAAETGEPEAKAEEAAPAPAPKVYTGRKLSLDFKDADIQDVLRLIADVSGINFVSNTDVQGRITIKLTDVPWDQALDVILKTNKPPLTQISEAENIIRINTLENVRREEDERRRIEKAKVEVVKTQKALEPLVTRSFHISYAKVEDIKARVENFMSERRKEDAFLQSDDRTNTLIIRDLALNVEEVGRIIQQLDTPTPAVQIEARIITVNSNYSKDLGIQWGATFVADAAHGNQTNMEFPNSINLGGTAGDPNTGDNFLVNLPAASPTAGIGLALGHIADTFNLDLRLSAMEQMGNVEILSNPKIFVVQNEEAVINVGRQLPIPKTDAEGNRTVEFKDVGIMLKVTPQVTADQKIFMDVEVERSDKGEDVNTTEGTQFSIDTQRAQTKVLLSDGETSVIGGLFQQTKSKSNSGVPGLSKLPFLGWLFKSKSQNDTRQELLIFLTPRVVEPL